jgi:Nucleoside 2-deoxyribosyltransferase/pfkB family carbohydrate kinase
MIVVGGVYSEYCYEPDWDQIFGSGGRGAATLTRLGVENVKLFTYLPEQSRRSAEATLSPYGVTIEAWPSSALYAFSYFHPMSEPGLSPTPTAAETSHAVSGDVLLVYGMLEGQPTISGKRVVFDPQSETCCKNPHDFIKSDEIALVLNQREFEAIYGSKNPDLLAVTSIKNGEFSCIVVKRGPYGCLVFDQEGSHVVPVFPTNSVFKIGSGDIFSASFAKFWCIDRLRPTDAAEAASKCAALYCDSRSIDALSELDKFTGMALRFKSTPRVYLAGPFFSLAQKFLVEEARKALLALGATVFSPMHDVGTDLPTEEIALRDLDGLKKCSAVLALVTDLDPGTIFEIGYARALNIPVVAFGEDIKPEHLTMMLGTRCIFCEDLCSALYNAVWISM